MTPVRGSLVRPRARPWFRGPATQQGDAIVMDGRHAERYDPMKESRIGIELARVRTPDDAVKFVTRFGLLDQPSHVFDFEPCPAGEIRQPFTDFERAAEDLRAILHVMIAVRKASVTHDAAAMMRLRESFGGVLPDADITVNTDDGPSVVNSHDLLPDGSWAPADDRTVLVRASHWAAMSLWWGLRQADARACVIEPAEHDQTIAPGGLRLGILPKTLLGFCYMTIAHAITATEPLATCDECQCVFVVDDARQRFCNPKCSGRARFRRFKTNQTVKTTSKKKRSRHGKTTRTR